MLTALRIIRDFIRVRHGHCERTGRPGRWVVYRTERGITIEVQNETP